MQLGAAEKSTLGLTVCLLYAVIFLLLENSFQKTAYDHSFDVLISLTTREYNADLLLLESS